MLIGVLLTVLLAGLAFGAFWMFRENDDFGEETSVVDASQDLEKAPMGCAMFTEDEIDPHIPGSRMDYKPGVANRGKYTSVTGRPLPQRGLPALLQQPDRRCEPQQGGNRLDEPGHEQGRTGHA